MCSKKRSHSEDTAVEETAIKRKQAIADSPTPLHHDSPSPKLRADSCIPIQLPVTDTQRKRAKRRELYAATMKLIKSDAVMQTVNRAPHATLKKHTRWTPYLTLPGFEQLPVHEQHAWKLCAVLFDETDPQKQAVKLKQWLIQTVSADAEAAIQSILKTTPDDPYAEIFTLMTFGRVIDAAALATKTKDIPLAFFLASPSSPKLAEKHRRTIITDKGVYYQKIWSVLSGKFDMVHDLHWKQLLLLHVMYGDTRPDSDPLDTLLGQFIARKQPVAEKSAWYSVIAWWWKRNYGDDPKATPSVNIGAWPARLAWRFAVSFPNEIAQDAVEDAIIRWAKELQAVDLADWVLMAALFSSSQRTVVSVMSRLPVIHNKYNVPEDWIENAKTAYANSLRTPKSTRRPVALI